MKINSLRALGSRPALCGLSLLVVATVAAMGASQDGASDEVTHGVVREEVGAMYESWGAARVAYDREAMEAIVAPEFHVLLYGQKVSGEKFISDVSVKRPGGSLTRFDADILTVRPSDEGWTVVITEKLEFELTGPDGATTKATSLWVTRDGWRKDGDEWLVTFSEAIGHESWAPGTTPPFQDW